MKTFYVTTTANMPLGTGCVEIEAEDRMQARDLAFQHMPDGRWSFDYASLEEIHPMDRAIRGYINASGFRSTK